MFRKIIKNGLEYYVSDLFPSTIKHCFTTRKNGETPPPLDGFSIGTAQYHQFMNIIESNRNKICETLDIKYQNLITTDQQHTDNIFILNNTTYTQDLKELNCTDSVITNLLEVPILLFFADCTPILVYDKKESILGLIHAGWKGTSKQIALKTISAMEKEFNSIPSHIVAAIGSTIGDCCYEVSEEVFEKLYNSICNIKNLNELSFSKKTENGKYKVNLQVINRLQLEFAGVCNIDVLDKCTSCANDLFFSHRKSNGKTGRHGLIAQMSRG